MPNGYQKVTAEITVINWQLVGAVTFHKKLQ